MSAPYYPNAQIAYYDNYGNPVDINGNVMDWTAVANQGAAGGMGYDNSAWTGPVKSDGRDYGSVGGGGGDSGYFTDQFGTPLANDPTAGEAIPWGTDIGAPDGPGEVVGPMPGPDEAPAWSAPTTTTPTYGGSTGGSGGGAGGGSLIDPFQGTFTPPAERTAPPSWLPTTPTYTAPRFTPPTYKPPPSWGYKDFEGPNAQTVLNTPGYQFRLNEGERALANAKAAQGIYGTGATLKAILGYGQDYASNEYQNEWNRELGAYETNRKGSLDAYNANYGTQYVDPYRFAYQGAMDSFAPQMAEFNANVGAGNLGYQTQAAAGQRQSENDYTRAWNQFLFDYDKFKDQRDSTFSKQWTVTSA